MNVNARLSAKKMEIVLQLANVLPPADQFANRFIERLHADFELQRARRECGNDLPQCRGQPVRDHLKMKEVAGTIPFQKKLQNRLADLHVEIERAIDKFELLHAAFEQGFQLIQQ